MKCPNCGAIQKYSEGMKCRKCGYRFAINPKRHDGLTDNKLLALAAKASDNGKYVFTRNQLFASWVQQKAGCGGQAGTLIVALILGGGGLFLLSSMDEPIFTYVLLGFAAFFLLLTLFSGGQADRKRFDRAVTTYLSKGYRLDNLIEKPSLHTPPPDWPETDIYDYGAEAVVIVDKDLTVDLLVKNGFHAENRCVVISASGYPDYVTDRVKQMLAERPDLPVYLLHDAEKTPFKERLMVRPPVPLEGRSITDLGLTLEQASKMDFSKTMAKRGSVPIDHFHYGLIAAGVATAILSGVALDDAMARHAGTGDSGGGDSGGYG